MRYDLTLISSNLQIRILAEEEPAENTSEETEVQEYEANIGRDSYEDVIGVVNGDCTRGATVTFLYRTYAEN